MNEFGILTSRDEQTSFDSKSFLPIILPGVYTGTLVARAWGKKYLLRCYFTGTEIGSIVAYGYLRKQLAAGGYGPRDSPTNFAEVLDGSRWRLKFKMSSQGNVFWAFAEEMK